MAARYPDQLWDSSDDDEDDNMDDLLRRRRRSIILGGTPRPIGMVHLCIGARSHSLLPVSHLSDRSPLVATEQESPLPASVVPLGARRAPYGDHGSAQIQESGLQTIDESIPDLRAVPTPQPYEYGAITHDSRDIAFQENGGVRPSSCRGSSSFKDISIPKGTSTYGQTLFNSTAILLGIGMLSEPFAFALSGWIGGTCLIISYGAIGCYTCAATCVMSYILLILSHSAKILAKIILSDRRLRTYSDIGRKAFGPKSNTFISFLFCLELFTVCVVLVTLAADSMHSVVPYYSSNTYKLIGLFV